MDNKSIVDSKSINQIDIEVDHNHTGSKFSNYQMDQSEHGRHSSRMGGGPPQYSQKPLDQSFNDPIMLESSPKASSKRNTSIKPLTIDKLNTFTDIELEGKNTTGKK